MNILIFQPVLQAAFQEMFEDAPGFGNQKQQAAGIRDESRCQQHDAGGEDQQRVKEFFSGHAALIEAGPDPIQCLQSLHARQVCAGKTGADYQQYGPESTDVAADLDQKVDFQDGNQGKGQKKFEEHGIALGCRVDVAIESSNSFEYSKGSIFVKLKSFVLDGIISVTYFRSKNTHRGDAERAEKTFHIRSAPRRRSQRLNGETFVTGIVSTCTWFRFVFVEIEGKPFLQLLLVEKITVFFGPPLGKAFLSGPCLGSFVKGGDQFFRVAFFLKHLITIFEVFDDVFHDASPTKLSDSNFSHSILITIPS
jgi:hypothetical protein